MTNEEQVQICKSIIVSCMWGSGIGSVILERLDRTLPMQRSWSEVSKEIAKDAKREYMGVITDESELRDYLNRGYWLTNGDSLFNPPPMNGLCKYVSRELYDKYTNSRRQHPLHISPGPAG